MNDEQTYSQIRHKWLGGLGGQIEEQIGTPTLSAILSILERRRGDRVYSKADVDAREREAVIEELHQLHTDPHLSGKDWRKAIDERIKELEDNQ